MALHFSPWLLLLVSTAFMASYMLASASDCRDVCKNVKSFCKSHMCAPSCRDCQDACKRCYKVYRVCKKRVCGERSCGQPGNAIDATHSGTYKYGNKVTYTCNTGYEMTAGNSTLICGKDKKWIGTKPTCSSKKIVGSDCADIYKKGIKQSGVYQIKPFSSGAKANQEVSVYCEMQTDGGGWTVFQRRFNGAVDFYRNWDNYTNGFGNVSGEYWLGLDVIHALTAARSSALRVDLWAFDGTTGNAKYGLFTVGDSESQYKLTVGSFTGTAGDSLKSINGRGFSTKDRDHDSSNSRHCAQSCRGGWWYRNCSEAHLNDIYYSSKVYKRDNGGIVWYWWKYNWNTLERTQMMVRPKSG